MLSYLAILALGLIGIYKIRDGLLILQNRRDLHDTKLNGIISNNELQCKQFKRAG